MPALERRVFAGYVVFVALGMWIGVGAVRRLRVGLDAAPLVGEWRWPPQAGILLPVVVGVVVVAVGPRLARFPWRMVPVVTALGAIAWTVALAASAGWSRLTAPITTANEYERFAATIDSPGRFLDTYLDRIDSLPVHVQGHPPGATLVPWALDRIGLAGAGWFAALLIASWGVGLAAVVVGVRSVGGEAAARRVAPALVLLPAAIWAGTSSDAMFAGVFAVGTALAVRGSRRSTAVAGVVLGIGLLFTYGGGAVLAIPVLVLLRRRELGRIAILGVGILAVLAGTWAASGFWWLDGLRATRRVYWEGIASARPSVYLTVLGNPTALALAVGPAVVVGLAARWRTEAATFAMAALLAVTVADLSLLSKGEVERIWLPFAVWLASVAPGDRRGWLAARAALGVGLQAVLVSLW